MSDASGRQRMAVEILNFEARRDAKGRLAVYELPSGDGGGSYEVGGINDRYHPCEAKLLADLITAGRYGEAEEHAVEIIANLTDTVITWSSVAAIESYLRDMAFNRGTRGSARILQQALGVEDDGLVGTMTRAALKTQEADPVSLLDRMRAAREQYERDVVGRDESSKFWKGLVNRWNKALAFAKTFLPENSLEKTAAFEAMAAEALFHAGGANPAIAKIADPAKNIDYYGEMLDLNDFLPINVKLDDCTQAAMISALGSPKMPLTTSDQPDRASPKVKAMLATRKISKHVRVTGIKPALDSLGAVMAEVFDAEPELDDVLSTQGMLNVRMRKPTNGKKSKLISNHAWGTAIDFCLLGQDAPGNTGDKVPRFIAVMIAIFNRYGWYSGIGFNDTMHFELANETIKAWAADGKLN